MEQESQAQFDAIVVGAGFAGLYMLQRFREMGLSARIIERAGGVGGTWYWNRYPGARCDIESMIYSYSWSPELEQEWHWTERYATQPEILSYIEHVADRFDLRRDIQFDTNVVAATFDESTDRWAVTTDRGDSYSASFFVMATGCLSIPRMPDIPGTDRFAGEAYHTALWPDRQIDFAGKRVGVLGAGSSAVQAIPAIAKDAEHVTVFQRTPPFSVEAFNRPLDPEVERDIKARYPEIRELCRYSGGGNPWLTSSQSVFSVTPEERELEFETRYAIGGFMLHAAFCDLFLDEAANELVSDFVRRKIRSRVDDPVLAEVLCPYEYPLATKRMCVDIDYYEAYNRENVTLVSVRETPIDEITESGVRVGDTEYPLDVLVFGTGFDAMTGAILGVDIRGRGGRTIGAKWADGPRSYLGLTIEGFPNLFTITGPGSPSVLSNVLMSIEQHVDFVADAVAHMRERGHSTIEPSLEAEHAWVDYVRELGDESLYPRANSWYMGANVPGKPRVLLPYVGGVGQYRRECERIVARGYEGFAFGPVPAHAV